jgi:hypothetical protein
MKYEHKTLLIDSQVREKVPLPEMKNSVHNSFVPWNFTGINEALDCMTAEGWEHYQSLEITDKNVCDNYSKHGVLLFFRKPK